MTALRLLLVADVSPLAVTGGAERVLWEEARRLARGGHDVRVLSRAPAAEVPAAAARDAVRVVHFPVRQTSLLAFLRGTVHGARRAAGPLLADGGVDVLNVHQPLAGYGVLSAPAARRLPSLYTFLSAAPLEYRSRRAMTSRHRGGPAGLAGTALLWAIEAACLRRASRIHVLSDFSAAQLWTLYRVPADRIVKIPGGVDVERFRPVADREAVRRRLGLPPARPLLLTVRNLEARMGLDTLLRAMALMGARRSRALLLIGGAGSLREPLEAQAAALGLADHVRFLGFVPEADLPAYYQAADVFVLPTRALEGFGLVTVEALACGTPVVGTPVGATPELLLPLDPALVLRDAGAEAMAAGLERFLDSAARDPEGARRLREACRRHVEATYPWERFVGALEGELEQLARAGAGAPADAVCPACGGRLRPSTLVHRGRRFGRCAGCATRALVPLPTSATLRHLYEVDYPRQVRPEEIAGPRRAMMLALLGRLGRLLPPGRLLDVGCGGGHLVAAAAARGWRSAGSDLSLAACAAGRAVGAPAVQADGGALPVRTGSQDAVTLVNVLDQTILPRGTLEEAYRVLRPGGVVVVRVPNGAFHALAARVLTRLGPLVRGRGWDRYPILTVLALGPSALRGLLERAGFDVVRMTNSFLASEPWTPQQSWTAAAGRALSRLIGAGAATVEALSGRRWLLGPSIEAYARKPAGPGDGRR